MALENELGAWQQAGGFDQQEPALRYVGATMILAKAGPDDKECDYPEWGSSSLSDATPS